MKKQLQGISLILFGIILMIFSLIDPWVPIIDDLLTPIALWGGVVSGVVGLIFSFQKDK